MVVKVSVAARKHGVRRGAVLLEEVLQPAQ